MPELAGALAGGEQIAQMPLLRRIFRASEHGWKGKDFHTRCDNRGPTVVVVRTVDGWVFGGVSDTAWGGDYEYAESERAFLFGLNVPSGALGEGSVERGGEAVLIPLAKGGSEHAMMDDPAYGPCFGEDGVDLSIMSEAHTHSNSCSYLPQSYTCAGASKTLLAGRSTFKVAEYEVFAFGAAMGSAAAANADA
jgi:hypothetical protein